MSKFNNLVARIQSSVKASSTRAYSDLVASVQLAWMPMLGLALLASAITFSATAMAVAVSAGDAVAKAEEARKQAILEADKALAVEKAKQGVPPTFLQSLYGVTVRPVSDAAQYSYNGAKNADGRAYNAVTSTFGSAKTQSTEAPVVSVVVQAPAATK